MKRFVVVLALMLCAIPAFAHFQVIMPSSDVVTVKNRNVKIDMHFTHPFEQGPVMEMVHPLAVDVYHNGTKTSLIKSIKNYKRSGKNAWSLNYQPKAPGDYIFAVTPNYYFEPAEDKYIQHIAKVIVNGYGMETGWDKPVGLKAEIVPLTRPYGLWKGNLFTGKVLYKGKPVPNAEIEVEYYNTGKRIKNPTEAHATQVVHADAGGVFSYAMPFAGWWGFAALIDDDVKIKKGGKSYPVELGGLIWVKTYGY